MATYVEGGTRSRTFSLITLVVVAAILYLARDVLVPLVVAILLSFLLAPGVTLLERWRLGRADRKSVV